MSALFGSNAEATDRRIAGTDQAQIATQRGTIVNPGGSINTYKIGKGGSVTLNSGLSGPAVSGLLDSVQTASASQIAALRESLGQQLTDAQKQIGKLAVTAQQTPEDKQNKSVVWIALAALGLVAVWATKD